MKLYKSIKKKGGLLSDDVIAWSLTESKDAEGYEISQIKTGTLLEIMYDDLSIDDVKAICEHDAKINEMFLAYISGAKTLKALAELNENVDSAKTLAILGIAT